jgi:hypothetical protein
MICGTEKYFPFSLLKIYTLQETSIFVLALVDCIIEAAISYLRNGVLAIHFTIKNVLSVTNTILSLLLTETVSELTLKEDHCLSRS